MYYSGFLFFKLHSNKEGYMMNNLEILEAAYKEHGEGKVPDMDARASKWMIFNATIIKAARQKGYTGYTKYAVNFIGHKVHGHELSDYMKQEILKPIPTFKK